MQRCTGRKKYHAEKLGWGKGPTPPPHPTPTLQSLTPHPTLFHAICTQS
jgi:hypothetical protein